METQELIAYADILSIDEQLWYINNIHLHPISNFLLMNMTHEDIALLKLHHQRVEDLLHRLAFRVRGPNDAHAGRVENDFATVFLFVVLRRHREKRKHNCLSLMSDYCELFSSAPRKQLRPISIFSTDHDSRIFQQMVNKVIQELANLLVTNYNRQNQMT